MTSIITELCQNFGIGLLLMYLETVLIKEPLYLIIFSRLFYQKEMEIIGKSKLIPFEIFVSIKVPIQLKLQYSFEFFIIQCFGWKEVKPLVRKNHIGLPFILKWSYVILWNRLNSASVYYDTKLFYIAKEMCFPQIWLLLCAGLCQWRRSYRV